MMHKFICTVISIKLLAPLGYLAVVGISSWIAADMRFLLIASQRRNQFAIEGRWAELEQLWKKASHTCRPFAWFHQRYLIPGSNAGQFGLFLFEQGRLEEALAEINQAIKQIESKPLFLRPVFRRATKRILCAALSGRVLILTGMGRYEEARETAARLGQASGSSMRQNASLALLELNCGRLDEALALAKTVRPEDHQHDAMRGLMAWAYSLKGDFAQAIETQTYEPSGISKFYRSEDLDNMNRSHEGSKLLELQGRKLAGIFPPARWIRLAGIYLEQEAFKNADDALDEAEKSLGSNPVLQIVYWRVRSRSCAAQGKSSEADDCIARIRAMTKQLHRRSTVMESHLAIGKSYLSLRRFSEALAELAEAQRNALHPIEKHLAAYWIARTHEAAGNPNDAISYYQQVASDPIPSWMRCQAEAVFHKPNPPSPIDPKSDIT